MQFPKIPAKLLSALLVILIPMLSTVFGMTGFTALTVGETAQVMRKTGSFMTGVCHPNPDYKMIRDANIGWIREDLPFPFDETGMVSRTYTNCKKKLLAYRSAGIRVLAITPNPPEYLEHGLDIRKQEHWPLIQAVARFYLTDLKDVVSAFQIANEMGVDRFTQPFTMTEAAQFIGVQLEALYPIRGSVLIGYNYGGGGLVTLPLRMLRYNMFCDFVGLDLYFGSFENVVKTVSAYPAIMRLFHLLTGKPILLAEFGYIGCGEQKTNEEKQMILEKYGVHSEKEAEEDPDAFIARLPETLRRDIEKSCAGMSDKEKAYLLFHGEYANHIYCELPDGFGLRDYPHNPHGQALFYADLIPRLRTLRFCIGAFIYMWHDVDHCYVCGQPDCPVETGWGLIDAQGQPKEAYYAVQAAFAPEASGRLKITI